MKNWKTIASAVVAAAALWGQSGRPVYWPLPDPGVVTTGQTLTPAGSSAVVGTGVSGLEFAQDGELIVSVGPNLSRLLLSENRFDGAVTVGLRTGFQSVRLDPATNQMVAAAVQQTVAGGTAEPVSLLRWNGREWVTVARELGSYSAGRPGIAARVNAAGIRPAVVPLPADNTAAVIDLETGRLVGKIQTGQAPFAAEVSADGSTAWVSNWGGRFARAGESTGGRQKVVVDSRGIASSGTVVKVDLVALRVEATAEVGLHSTALVMDEARGRLYVTNANEDSISVLSTATMEEIARWRVNPETAHGSTPTAAVLDMGGERLYVACGGLNAVAVLETERGAVQGYIPTGWYPSALAMSPGGHRLAVGSLLGAGAGGPSSNRRAVQYRRGMLSVVDIPDERQLRDYTSAVMQNNRLTRDPQSAESGTAGRGCGERRAIPLCAGDPSPIEHVVFIIKENRTYDQVLGDLFQGNGDVSLSMYPGHTTPNHHRLAEQFTTLDNFYATGGVSAEGHNWLTQAYAPSYVHWPGYLGRSYPFDGTDPLAYSPNGFLWDLARSRGRSVRVYGELVPSMQEKAGERIQMLRRWEAGEDFTSKFSVKAQVPTLNEVLAPNYPSYSLTIPDVVRSQIFLKDLQQWSESKLMPNLVIIQLPGDHTMGTTPGESTPLAMIADNDLALGQIVDALTKSPFWPKMAIFVVEDDAQDGVDHVDGHRTVALAVSPYTKRRQVDSTFYSHQSMLKTIELILGLPTMSLFDLIATDMRASFQEEPDLTPYDHEVPQVSLFEVNPALSTLNGQARKDALASRKMNWRVPDDVPTEKLNLILWRQAKGLKAKYPGVRSAAFRPPIVETEEEDEEDDDR